MFKLYFEAKQAKLPYKDGSKLIKHLQNFTKNSPIGIISFKIESAEHF